MPTVSPTVASTISTAPRALSPTASATLSGSGRRAPRAPRKAPANFEALATASATSAQSATSGTASSVRSVRSPAVAKKSGAKNARVTTSSGAAASTSWKRERPSTIPAMNAPKTASRCNAWVDAPLAHAERGDEEQREPAERHPEPARVERARARETRRSAEQDPPDDVVHHGGADQHLRDVAAHEIEVVQDLRDLRKRREGERGAHEQREHLARRARPDERLGEREAERDARRERHEQAADRHPRGRGPESTHQGEVRLHPGQHEQQREHLAPEDEELVLVRHAERAPCSPSRTGGPAYRSAPARGNSQPRRGSAYHAPVVETFRYQAPA